MVPITFLKEGSYAKLRGYAGATTLNISLEFRTYEIHGLLIYHKFNTDGHVKVSVYFRVTGSFVNPPFKMAFIKTQRVCASTAALGC